MPKIMVSYVRTINSLSERIWNGLVWIVPFSIAVLLYETFSRYALRDVCIWSTELLEFVIVCGGLLGGMYLLRKNEHIRVDIFTNKLSPRRKAIIDVATFFLYIYIVLIVITFITSTKAAYISGQASVTPWGPIFWPVKLTILIAAILLLLQGIANLIRDIAVIRGEDIE